MSIVGIGRQPEEEDELPVWLPRWRPPERAFEALPEALPEDLSGAIPELRATPSQDRDPVAEPPVDGDHRDTSDHRAAARKDDGRGGPKRTRKQRKKDRKREREELRLANRMQERRARKAPLAEASPLAETPPRAEIPPSAEARLPNIALDQPPPSGPATADPAEPDAEPEAAVAGEPRTSGVDEGDPNRIGIVFVHGIDGHRPGETLLAWASPIVRLLTAWATTTYGVRPQNDPTISAGLDFTGARRPVVVASVSELGHHPAQTWIMTEAWWATHVSPPPLGAMLRWLLPGELIRVWSGIVSGMAGRAGIVFRLADVLLLFLFLLPAGIAVLIAAILLRLLRAIPWSPIRDVATRWTMRLFLLGGFGDVRVLLMDRVQAANARGRVAEAIRDCRAAGCGTIVLIGQSSGALVAYMTLADETYATLPVRELITVGQTLGTAWRLGHADEYDVPDRSPDRLYRGDRLRGNVASLPFRAGLRWHDFWATHDPGPAGPLMTGSQVTFPELAGGASTPVFNRMSLRRDQATYWDNDEELVLPVARLIDEAPAGPQRRSRFFPEGPSTRRVERRRHRVRLLRLAWIAITVSVAASIALAILDPLVPGNSSSLELAGRGARDALATLVENLRPALDSAGLQVSVGTLERNAAIAIGLVLIVVSYWLVARTTTWLWVAWDARERRIALQPIPEWRSMLPLAIQLGLCAGAGLWLLSVTATGTWSFAVPSAAALVLAVVAGALTRRGRIRRPTIEELAYENVLP